MTGIILAGGKNSRISLTKALIKIGPLSILENNVNLMKQLFDEVIIVTNKFADYRYLGVTLTEDSIPNKGPLGGLYTGLKLSSNYYNFIIACDMPFLDKGIFHCLKAQLNSYDVIIPEHNGFIEPLCAIYSKNCITPISAQLNNGDIRIRSFFDQVKVKKVNSKNFDEMTFFNINTQHDLEKAKKYLASKSILSSTNQRTNDSN